MMNTNPISSRFYVVGVLDALKGNQWLKLVLILLFAVIVVHYVDVLSRLRVPYLSEWWYEVFLLVLLVGWFAILSASSGAGNFAQRFIVLLPFLLLTLADGLYGLLVYFIPLIFIAWIIEITRRRRDPFVGYITTGFMAVYATLILNLWINSYILDFFVVFAFFIVFMFGRGKEIITSFVTGFPLLMLILAHIENPSWYPTLMELVVIPGITVVVLTLLYEIYHVDGERDRLWHTKAPFGSADAKTFRKSGRLLGCGSTFLFLFCLAAISFTAARYYFLEPFQYQPSNWIRWMTALALFLYVPILPYRLVLLVMILVKRSDQLTDRYNHRWDLGKEFFGDFHGAEDFYWKPMQNADSCPDVQCKKEELPEELTKEFLKRFSMRGCKACMHRRDAVACWREVVLDTFYTWHPGEDCGGRAQYPKYVVMVAIYDEASAMPRLVENLARLNYPDDRLEILLLVEENEFDKGRVSSGSTSSGGGSARRPTFWTGFNSTRKNSLAQLMMLIQGLFRAIFYVVVPRENYEFGGGMFRRWLLGNRDDGQPGGGNSTNEVVFRYEGSDYNKINTPVAALKAVRDLSDEFAKRRDCFKVLVVPRGEPQTKPRALNYGLYNQAYELKRVCPHCGALKVDDKCEHCSYIDPSLCEVSKESNFYEVNVAGEKEVYCTIYDAEDRPEEEQLRKAVAKFKRYEIQNVVRKIVRNDKPGLSKQQLSELGLFEIQVACLQAQLMYENLNDNWIISLFKAEYAAWYNLLLPSLAETDLVIPLGGTSNHFKYHVLKDEIGGWDAYNVTEDADLGIWFARKGQEVRLLESTTWELADGKLMPWVKQRSRWIKGYIQTYFVHMRSPIRLWYELDREADGFWSTKRFRRFFGFQLIVGSAFVLPLLNIFFWLTTVVYLTSLFLLLFFDLGNANPVRIIFLLNFYQIIPWGTGSFFVGNVIFFIILMLGHWSHPKPGNYRRIITLWLVYWLAMSWAAWKALYEFVVAPSYWEKSSHEYINPGA